MKLRSFGIFILVLAGISQVVWAQNPSPEATPTPKLSEILTINLASAPQTEITRADREQAYAKLLEGQRYLLTRGSTGNVNPLKMARQALQRSLELDPRLAEGYTALAELAIAGQPQDIDEAISLAAIATRIQPDNFGGHRIMARLYTFKSRLNTDTPNKNFSDKAIASWKEVARLDPRNAEAWAFLSEFYDKASEPELRIAALKKWLASAPPIEVKFWTMYWERVNGGDRDSLLPERASLKLGPALMKMGKAQEAVSVLSNLVAEDPENVEAIEMLRDAIESVDGPTAATVIESIQQAVYSDPENLSLIDLLAQVNAMAGKIDEAAKVLQDATKRFGEKDKNIAAFFQASLGDLYINANRLNEGIAAYQKALTARGIASAAPTTDDDREFAANVFSKMIRAYKEANRPLDVKAVTDRARQVFGKDDLFADTELISFYRETGKKAEALQAVRAVRLRIPNDYTYLRLEATLLGETGHVDQAVAMVRNLIEKKPLKGVAGASTEPTIESLSPMYDDFLNTLFISNLYSNAHRGKEAVAAANTAYNLADSASRKEMAKTTLSIAQEMAGDFAGAEATLREILKKTPDNPVALNNLGYFLIERDQKLEEALEMIKKAVALEPNNASFLDSLGWAYYKLGNDGEAEKNLLAALRINNMSSTIQEHVGDIYLKQGKADKARTAWERALVLSSDAADIVRLKGKLGKK